MSEVSGSREELPRVRGHGRRPGGDTLRPRSGAAAKRSYPASKVSGGGEETPCVRGQGSGRRSYPASEASRGREETPRVRGQGRPGEATSRPRPGAVTLRSHLEPEARGGSWERQPEERWLRRHRMA